MPERLEQKASLLTTAPATGRRQVGGREAGTERQDVARDLFCGCHARVQQAGDADRRNLHADLYSASRHDALLGELPGKGRRASSSAPRTRAGHLRACLQPAAADTRAGRDPHLRGGPEPGGKKKAIHVRRQQVDEVWPRTGCARAGARASAPRITAGPDAVGRWRSCHADRDRSYAQACFRLHPMASAAVAVPDPPAPISDPGAMVGPTAAR